ncbi:hypothetical protein [Rhodoferax sp. OV413]|uniref:hypothetical protein n=1 Tax=Rhodoferax sp. OV413 TaxID=1855285 RepID=UPI000B842E9F|nr:hypothetical protein [Rhodoferax sp. OV413]
MSLTLAGSGCAEFSPQVADQRPTYGFTSRAASSVDGDGFYGELCGKGAAGPTASGTRKGGVDCPVFYGLMPAALDDADAARLRLLKVELNESGAPWLATAVGLPLGAYALYRGIFGLGDGARREIAKLGLAGAATYSWLSARESRPRQTARQAAIEALSCAMYGASARYLYERDQIVGTSTAGGKPPFMKQKDGSLSLSDAQAEVRDKATGLRTALSDLRREIEKQPASSQRTGSYRNGCDAGSSTTACQLRGQGKAPVVVEENAELKAANALAKDADAQLLAVGLQLLVASALRDRIDKAPFELLHAVKRIEDAGNKAVLATEADVATLRATVGNLKLGTQGLSAVLAQAAATPASGSSTTDTAFKATSRIGATSTSGGAARDLKPPALAPQTDAVRNASLKLLAAMDDLKAHTNADFERAKLVQDEGNCQFVTPGVKLVVDPAGTLTVEPGSAVRLSALGGTSLPTVALTGNTSLKTSDVLRIESDSATGRQSIGVVVTPDAKLTDQDLRLVFRNEGLIEVRDVHIRKSGAKK